MGIDKQKKGFLAYFLLVTVVFLMIHSVSYYKGITENRRAELIDTDTYMRLVRVEQLAETGDWYNSVIHRSNYPYGDELHWTRPLDVILLGGAYALAPFTGFKQGLLYWGIIISPLIGILTLLALYWAARRVMSKESRRLLWILFIAQPILLQVFYFGRPDHHSLLMLLFILLLGCLFRMVEERENNRYVILGGLIASFAMWVSVEFIFAIIVVYITLGVLWLLKSKAYARQMLLFSLILFIFSTAALFIERPLSALLIVEYDKISIAHLFVFMVAVIATYLLTLVKSRVLSYRLLETTGILLSSGLIIWLVFPAFYQGPMAGVNKAIVPIWLSKVTEVQPVWSLEPYHMTIIFGSIILFTGYIVYLIVKNKFSDHINLLAPLVGGFLIFLPLGLYQVRMDYYLLVIIIMLLAVLLSEIISSISKLQIKNLYKPVLRVLVMLVFILGLPGVGILLSLEDAKDNSSSISPDLKLLSSFLNEYQQDNNQDKTILTFIDFGPQILYRTDFNVVSTPYHRNDQGILFNYNVMAEDNLNYAKEMLNQREIDLIIICSESSEKRFYKKSNNNATFYEKLISGQIPDFIEEISLPADLKNTFNVYKIKS
jgi:asparagine N-glycosylation enzyme membrane subunit Stt3